MSDDEPLLLAIEARPADDTPRLAYADWLDEHGRPAEAAFLRAEVAWQRRPPASAGWLRLGRALFRTAHATPGDWRERVSRPRLAGTTWRWVDPEVWGVYETVQFHAGGRFEHCIVSEHRGEADRTDGAWRQFGPRVLLTINKYSLHRGTARGDAIPLRGRSIALGPEMALWRWTLAPPAGPDCLRDPR